MRGSGSAAAIRGLVDRLLGELVYIHGLGVQAELAESLIRTAVPALAGRCKARFE